MSIQGTVTGPQARPLQRQAHVSTQAQPLELQRRPLRYQGGKNRPRDAAWDGQVRRLQERLKVDVDGDFGRQTLAAVRAFQREHGLQPDGVVGDKTLARLNQGRPQEEWVELPRLPIGKGHRHRGQNTRIQELLNQKGAELEADGIFGGRTEAALKKFQSGQGLDPSGKVDQTTLERLRKPQEEPSKPKPKSRPAPQTAPGPYSHLSMPQRLELMDQAEKPIRLTPELRQKLPGAIKTLEKLAGKDGVWNAEDRSRNLQQLDGAIKKEAHREVDRRFDAEVTRRADQSWLSRKIPLFKGLVRAGARYLGEEKRAGAHQTFGAQAEAEGRKKALDLLNQGFERMGMKPPAKLKAASETGPQVSAGELREFRGVLEDLERQGGSTGMPKGAFKEGLSVDFLKDVATEKPAGLALIRAQKPELAEAASKPVPLTTEDRREVRKALGTLKKLAGEDGVWDRRDLNNNVRQLDGELRSEVRNRIDKEFDQRFDKEFKTRFGKEFDKRFNREAAKRIKKEIAQRIRNNPLLGIFSALGGRGYMESKGWEEAARQRPAQYRQQYSKYYPVEKKKARVQAHHQYTPQGMEMARVEAHKQLQQGLDRLGLEVGKASHQWSGQLPAVTQAELSQLRQVLSRLEGKIEAMGLKSQARGFSKGLPTRFLEHIYEQKPIGLTAILTQ